MRIFCAVRHALDPRRFYGGLWSGNFYPALRQLGHEVVESQVDLAPASEFLQVASDFTPEERALRGRLTEQILDEVRRAHAERPLDLFLGYFYNAHFDPAGYEQIHRLGIPTVNFYCNSIYQFELVEQVAAKVQHSWHAERDARARYLRAGARPVWVQMAADPQVYRPVEGQARAPDACFVGQRYADRDRWLAALVDGGVPVAIYGQGWGAPESAAAAPAPSAPPSLLGRARHRAGSLSSYLRLAHQHVRRQGVVGGAVRIAKQAAYRQASRHLGPKLAPRARGLAPSVSEAFARHEVVLNFSNVWADGLPGSALIPHVRLRDFEGPMCRTCFLTGHSDEITEFYKVGEEIDTYASAEELVSKARHYLAHPEQAERLREAGYRRALRDHTWVRRFQQLFGAIGVGE